MNITRTIVRNLTRSAPARAAAEKEVYGEYKHIKDKYRHFQMDNDLLIHQRGGTMDYILFGSTVLINGVGILMALQVYYKMAFNKK